MDSPPNQPSLPRAAPPAVFAAALALALLLGQEVFYKADGQRLVLGILDPDFVWPQHQAYLPAARLLHGLLAPLGSSPFQSARALSALGYAVGAAATAAAFARLVSDRSAALLALGLAVLSPPWLFFATVVEFHGPFLAPAGLAFLAFALLHRRPNAAHAVLLGALTAVATAFHASGLALPAVFLPWFLALRSGRLRADPRPWLLAGLVLAVHLLLAFALTDPLASSRFVEAGFRRPQSIEWLPQVLADEALLPYLPLSLLWPLAFLRRELRPVAWAFLLGLVPYAYGALKLLVGEQERGAYLLPLVLPAAWLTARALPRPAAALAVGLSSALALAGIARHDRPAAYRAYARAVRAASRGRPTTVLVGEGLELSALLSELPAWRAQPLDLVAPLSPDQVAALFPRFEEAIRAERRGGRLVLLSEGGRRYLADPKAHLQGGGPAFLRLLEARFRLVEVRRRRPRFWLLEPRS